jgi:hypothetical protein
MLFVECIWIEKQKVCLFSKFKKNEKKVVVNALSVCLDL